VVVVLASRLVVAAISACMYISCGNGASVPSSSSSGSSPTSFTPAKNEQWFTSDDGWSFLAPKDLMRNTAPGTTGFAVYRPPPGKPILNIVLTTQPHAGDVAALVDAERTKVKIVKETPTGSDVLVEETWPIGDDDGGRALVLFAVRNGVAIRLACIGSESTFESQRPICTRALASLRHGSSP
jgi:hypothetical protein